MEPLTPRPRQKEEICRHHDDDHRGDQYEDHDNGLDKDHVRISSQAGLRADGAGESALPAEELPWRLRALSREREL